MVRARTAHLQMPVEQALELFEPQRRPQDLDLRDGYLDLLGVASRRQRGAATDGEPRAAAHLPALLAPARQPFPDGLAGPGAEEEHRIALEMLSISPGDRVLDVACGPGNFTRDFAVAAGDGLVVGIDASPTMLERRRPRHRRRQRRLRSRRRLRPAVPRRQLRRRLLLRRAVPDRGADAGAAGDRPRARSRGAGRAAVQLQPGASARAGSQRGRARAERGARLRARRADRGPGGWRPGRASSSGSPA